MTAILYPVADNAEQALARPLGFAARERDAAEAAAQPVIFTTDAMGPAFATRTAAEEAYRAQASAPYCRLTEQLVPVRGRRLASAQPVNADGRRWPQPPAEPPQTVLRLMVSYWRIASAERPIEAPQARTARRASLPLDPQTLRAIARQPLRPVKPQQPLDIGLFEVRPPDAPHILIPDE